MSSVPFFGPSESDEVSSTHSEACLHWLKSFCSGIKHHFRSQKELSEWQLTFLLSIISFFLPKSFSKKEQLKCNWIRIQVLGQSRWLIFANWNDSMGSFLRAYILSNIAPCQIFPHYQPCVLMDDVIHVSLHQKEVNFSLRVPVQWLYSWFYGSAWIQLK